MTSACRLVVPSLYVSAMSPMRRRQLRLASIGLGLLTLVGASMAYVGVAVWNQTHWPTVTSRATSCRPVYATRRSPRYGVSTWLAGQSCSVTWQINGQPHVGVVELAASTRDGEEVKLYVNGDSALSDHTQSGGLLVGGIGVAIWAFGVGLPLSAWIRSRRVRRRRERQDCAGADTVHKGRKPEGPR